MSVLNNPVLWLNKSWLAHDTKTVEESFSTVCSDRGLFLDSTYVPRNFGSWINLPVEDGAEFIQLTQTRIRVPEIMLLAEYNRIPDRSVVFCRRNLWRRDKGRCFVPETLILMEDGGFQRIDSIEVGDRILDFEGKVQDVEFVFSKHTNDDLVVLRHRGNGDFLTCTADHRILVSDKNFNIKWVEAGNITTNDYLCELNLYQGTHLQNSKVDRLFDEDGARFISKVTSVARMPYGGLVYDLQISGSHTYVADFVCVHNCQYCGQLPDPDDVTMDHIHPKSKGGLSTFENCVLCCTACNLKKGNQSLARVGMRLQRLKKHPNGGFSTVFYERPKCPRWNPLYALRRRTYPKSWATFLKQFDESLYWEVELDT